MLSFKPVIELNDFQIEKIREIRNKIEIRKWMFNKKIISKREHSNYISKIKREKNRDIEAIFMSKLIVGFFQSKIFKDKLFWGFYVNKKVRKKGIGPLVEYIKINELFKTNNALFCEVLKSNYSIIKLHKKFGFKEYAILKDSIKLKLEKERWDIFRNKLLPTINYIINKNFG